MKDIAIYGAGNFGREISCLINIINKDKPQWNFLGFFDDTVEKGAQNEYGKILGGIEDLNQFIKPLSVVIAIASPKTVNKIVNGITNKLVDFPNIIAPNIIYLDKTNLKIGRGNIICSSCLVSCNVNIGDFNIFNGFIPIGHDVVIGNFNSFMPSVNISGDVIIGNRNFFGVNSVILQKIEIGNETVIGANSLIIRKTKDGMTYIGNPAKIVNY